jgi:hypothetical protein
MLRLSMTLLALVAVASPPAFAQMPETPGPGGIPIAPGARVHGYTPGGIGPGGVEVAPGPAARNVPMYRIGPGDVALPLRPDPSPDEERARLDALCGRGNVCVPDGKPQSLQLTITSRDAGPGRAPAPDTPIDSIADLFAALRTCWEPPAPGQAYEGAQMSVRFSFRRTGEIIAPPRVTYTAPGTPAVAKQAYREAIMAALRRCAPLPFSDGFSAAIAGRPISVRYVDDRSS